MRKKKRSDRSESGWKALAIELEKQAERNQKKSLPNEIEVPEGLLLKINEKVDQVEHSRRRRQIGTILSRVAILFLCVLLVSGLAMQHSEAVKRVWHQIFMKVQGDHVDIDFRTASDIENQVRKQLVDWQDYYYPEYLPKGYQLSVKRCRKDLDFKTILFFNGTSDLCFDQQQGKSMNQKVDGEDVRTEEVAICEMRGFLIIKGEKLTLTWVNERERWFQLTGAISKDDMIKVAESLFYIN